MKGQFTYKNDKLNGPGTTWFENGKMKGQFTYKNDKLNGPASAWYDDGGKKEEVIFKDDSVITRTRWDNTGTEIKE